jgi:hypothetical protein
MREFDEAIYARLSARPDLAGRVFNGIAPLETPPPYVIFALASGVEEHEIPRRALRLSYIVKAAAWSHEEAWRLAREADLALDNAQILDSFWCRRSSLIAMAEPTEEGRVLFWAGGIYLVRAEVT